MTDTTFVDQQTIIQAAWCNDINDHVYNDTPISPSTTVHDSSKISNSIKRVANIAAIRSITPVSTYDVETQGYYTAGDGGHGIYYGVTGAAVGTYVDNGCTIIVPTGGNGTSAWLLKHNGTITLKQAGAKGDGATDDTVSVQAAVNAMPGGTVFANPALYKLTSAIAIPPSVTLIGEGKPYPVAAYNPTTRLTGAVFNKAHAGHAFTITGSGAGYSECGGMYNISVISNSTTYPTGDGFRIDKLGSYVIEDCNAWSVGGNGFSIGVTAGDVTGQIFMRNLYTNNVGGYSYYFRAKWLRGYGINSDGGTWGAYFDNVPEGYLDGFHFEGFSVGGIKLANGNTNTSFLKGFVALTNVSSLYGVQLDSVAGNSGVSFDAVKFVGRSGVGVIGADIGSAAWHTRFVDCYFGSFPVGISNNSSYTCVQEGTIFDSCALPIQENGTATKINGITTVGTTGSYSIDHLSGGGGIWSGNVLDKPIKPTAYGGAFGNYGTNIVKSNTGFKTAAKGETTGITSGTIIPHGMSVTPYTVFMEVISPYARPADLKIAWDGTNITPTWTGGTTIQFSWAAYAVCSGQG